MKPNLTDALCARCGLCCDGSLFADVELAGTDETSALEVMGLEIDDDEGGGLLLQPCRALQGQRCSIYPHRPDCCRTFECRLLQETKRGAVGVEQAKAKIAQALKQIGRVKELIVQLRPGNQWLPLKERCDEALAFSAEAGANPLKNQKRVELKSAMISAERLIQETFLGNRSLRMKPLTMTLRKSRLLLLPLLLLPELTALSQGEVLYNGIQLTSPWPPTNYVLTLEPVKPPYLAAPPAVIPIDVGRQLFVDDFLIESTTLKRTFHQAELHPANPILKPDKPWEQETYPTAMPFSDGVWYDPAEKIFKMWYMGGYCASICYATSKDGIQWDKPSLDVKPGSNIVFRKRRDSTTVWLDLEEKDPDRRYKLFRYDNTDRPETGTSDPAQSIFFSRDGIHWKEASAPRWVKGDRSTAFYNPFRKVWVYGIRDAAESGKLKHARVRRYWEHPDVLTGSDWSEDKAPYWVSADRLDPRHPEMDIVPELYNLDCVAYESVMLGLFDIWVGQKIHRPKPNYLTVGFSRDGFHWDRTSREPFIPLGNRKGDWNWGNVQSAGGGCLVVGDKLYFYVSGRAGVDGSAGSGVCTTGLATLRRDGFASMDASDAEGTLITRPVVFRGKYLFVNTDADEGELRVEVLDKNGKIIKSFTRSKCTPVRADKTLQAVRWGRKTDLSALTGKPVKFRFHLKNARLYSFWVSPQENGASHGYVAAGGPGFTGPTDTTGGK